MKGDWIDFTELCRRVPEKSASTLRRMVTNRQISYRQRVQGGKLEFNWFTVERELAALERRSTARIGLLEDRGPSPEIVAMLAQMEKRFFAELGLLREEIRKRGAA